MPITTTFDQKGATPYQENIFTKKPFSTGQSYTPGLLNPDGSVGSGKLTFSQPAKVAQSSVITGGKGSVPATKSGLIGQPSSQPKEPVKVASTQSSPPPAKQSLPPVYNPLNDQITNTQDQVIKATQDKLKNLQNQLKTAQSQGAGMNDQVDTQGNVMRTPTFSGLVGNLSNQTASPYNQIATNSAQQLQNMAGTNPALSGEAFNAYTQAVENQRKLREGIASKYGAIESQAIPLEFQQGREQALARQYASQLEAGQAAINQQQTAIGQQITGAQTQQQGLLGAGNLGLTGQSTAQSALGTAAGLLQPVDQFGVKINPITGQPIGGGSFADLARQGGTLSGIQSGAAASAAAGGNIQAEQQAQKAGYQSAHQQAQNLQSQLTDLISAFGLNPSDVNAVNAGIQQIAANISDPRYKSLENYINDIASRYAQILTPTGGSQTDTTRSIAASMLDATAKGASIINVLDTLDQQAQAVISGVMTSGSSAPSPSSGGSLYDF